MSTNLYPHLSEDQIEEFAEAFQLIDTDGDGKINGNDLGLVMRSLGQNPTEAELQDFITNFEPSANLVEGKKTSDCEIDFPNFLTMMARQITREVATVEMVREALGIFDKNDDGFISTEELRHILGSLGEKLQENELDQLFEQFSNTDGRVNCDQMVNVLMEESQASRANKPDSFSKLKEATSNQPEGKKVQVKLE